MPVDEEQSMSSSLQGETSLSIRTNQSTPIKRTNTTNRTSVLSETGIGNGLRRISSTGVVEDRANKNVSKIRNYKSSGSLLSPDEDTEDGPENSDMVYELPPLKTPLKKRFSTEPDTLRNSGVDWSNRTRIVSNRSSRDFDGNGIDEMSSSPQRNERLLNGVSANQNFTIEQLNKQIVSYRLKIKSLYEIIRQLNTDESKGEHNKRNSYMENLLSNIPKEDEFHELKRVNINLEHVIHKKNQLIDELNSNLQSTNEELLKTKHDHAETLEMTREYLEHSEELAKHIDYILDYLLDSLTFAAEEKEALENARKIGAAFAMVKLNALSSVVKKLVNMEINQKHVNVDEHFTNETPNKHGLNTPEYTNDTEFAIANSTGIQGPINSGTPVDEKGDFSLSDQILNSQMEEAIEELHKEYDSFVKAIRVKLEKSERLEEILLKKLSEQDKLIHDIALLDNKNSNEQEGREENEEKISTVLNLEEISHKATAELTKSYQDHIENLTSHIDRLNKELEEKNNLNRVLKEELEDERDELSKMKQRMIRELNDEKELYARKEENWKDLLSSYEEQLNIAHEDAEELMKTISELKKEIQEGSGKNQENVQLLQDELSYLQKKSHSYSNEIFQLTRDNKMLAKKLNNLSENANKMNNIIKNYKEHSNVLQQFDSDFESLKKQLLLHLQNILNIFMTILEEKSVKQALKKLYSIDKIRGLDNTGYLENKLGSLYVYVETASQSIIDNYVNLVKQETEKPFEISNEKEIYLRIEELQRKWNSERERRKLDSEVANIKINGLELENARLKEQLRNMSLKDSNM